MTNLISSTTFAIKTGSSTIYLVLTNNSHRFQYTKVTKPFISNLSLFLLLLYTVNSDPFGNDRKLVSTFLKSQIGRFKRKIIYYRKTERLGKSRFLEEFKNTLLCLIVDHNKLGISKGGVFFIDFLNEWRCHNKITFWETLDCTVILRWG